MKKQLVLVTGLAVLAAPAFASKARLQALGESTTGSQYINDNRNIFLNAAHVNNHKDLVTFETGASSQVTDGAATPRAEGGYFFSNGNMVYGVQLGQQSDTAHALRVAGLNSTTTDVAEKNTVDLFVGGDAGVKWGASLLYASSEDKRTTATAAAATDAKENNSMRARLGASQGNWDAFANISLTNEVKLVNGDKFEGNLGYQLGGSYMLNSYSLIANYSSFTADGTVSGDKKEVSLEQMEVGVGRATKLNDKTQLFTKITYRSTTAENKRVTAAGNGNNLSVKKNESTAIPVVIGLEHDAASWLTLRGSVGQNVFINEVKGAEKNSDTSTTVVNAGATLKFGDLSVDGVIGNSTAGTDGATTLSENTNGTIRLDTLMSRVSMTYRF
ncbi:MAG: hypothetical protein LW878_12325 [Proteobacteria bacterium]|nr:hypothetical protein [Pseudomonadota bacterium]